MLIIQSKKKVQYYRKAKKHVLNKYQYDVATAKNSLNIATMCQELEELNCNSGKISASIPDLIKLCKLSRLSATFVMKSVVFIILCIGVVITGTGKLIYNCNFLLSLIY